MAVCSMTLTSADDGLHMAGGVWRSWLVANPGSRWLTPTRVSPMPFAFSPR